LSQILENKDGLYFASFAFLPEKPCQTGTLVKRLLLMLINVGVLRTGCIILPPAPSVLQEGSSDGSDAGVKTRGSVRRTSGLVQTPLWEALNGIPKFCIKSRRFRRIIGL
jgi:hypothetical protein